MNKDTFRNAPARTQREILFDDIQEIKDSLKSSKKHNVIAAFSGGFVAVFAACGGYTLLNYMKIKVGG